MQRNKNMTLFKFLVFKDIVECLAVAMQINLVSITSRGSLGMFLGVVVGERSLPRLSKGRGLVLHIAHFVQIIINV